jgi:mRNA interferase HigB
MRIVGRERLSKAEEVHRGSGLETALAVWVKVVENANWRHFPDVKSSWGNADYVKPHVVFNIKGNDFRLTSTINYRTKTVVVERVQTHADYTRKGP